MSRVRVATYVFMDLETTGLPKEEYNKTRITEISLVAVKRQHLEETRAGAAPRVQHKLTLCLNPRRRVSDVGARVTGLSNDLLEHEPSFNLDTYNLIKTFLDVLTPPVCLVAHNGLHFDFPILKNHLEKLNVTLSETVLCADSLSGFYNILEIRKLDQFKQSNGEKVNGNQHTYQIGTTNVEPSTSKEDELDLANIDMKTLNETTPKANKFKIITKRHGNVRRRLWYGGDTKPEDSYKLSNIYKRVLNKEAVDAHRAENDCILMLEICTAISQDFVEWVDYNCVPFFEIEPMRLGVPMP